MDDDDTIPTSPKRPPPGYAMEEYMSGNRDLYRLFDAIYNRSVAFFKGSDKEVDDGEDQLMSAADLSSASDVSGGQEEAEELSNATTSIEAAEDVDSNSNVEQTKDEEAVVTLDADVDCAQDDQQAPVNENSFYYDSNLYHID